LKHRVGAPQREEQRHPRVEEEVRRDPRERLARGPAERRALVEPAAPLLADLRHGVDAFRGGHRRGVWVGVGGHEVAVQRRGRKEHLLAREHPHRG
jgi:hypothetical protein